MNKRGEATTFEDPALIRIKRDRKGNIIAFGRTRLGQTVYDICLSSMSAAEVAKRHKLKRDFVLRMRNKPSIKKLRQKARRAA